MTRSITGIPAKLPLRLRLACLLLCTSTSSGLHAVPWDPSVPDYKGRKGTTLYVSKLGDDSDGSSWEKGFRSIQAALDAVSDGQGGHRIVVRPDRYVEANLAPAFKGAAGAYNAGETAVDKWLIRSGRDRPLLFLGSIEYRETRRYVEKVSSSFWMYQWLYGEDPSPWKSFFRLQH